MTPESDNPSSERRSLSRRGFLTVGGSALVGAAGGIALGSSIGGSSIEEPQAADSVDPATPVDFYGPHQTGIETTPAVLISYVGVDLIDPTKENLRRLLTLWTDDAARLVSAEPALGDTEPEIARQIAGLTIGIGLSRQLLMKVGLADAIPEQLVDLPEFSTDALEEPWGQTNLLLQIGADDPLVLSHASRMLVKDGAGLAEVRWVQNGFRATAPAFAGSSSTRNLMGQVDGTANPDPGTPGFAGVVWIDEEDGWLKGGTILVLRRIRMHLDEWDVLDRSAQELMIGRRVESGAPLGGSSEGDALDLEALDGLGLPVIPMDAHARVAHAATLEEMIFRRPYHYVLEQADGTRDAGQIFAAYTSDPRRSFIPMQQRLAENDAFNRWITTIGSAVYAFPRGVAEGETWASELIA
jgi:dye decolorizing peroxidase